MLGDGRVAISAQISVALVATNGTVQDVVNPAAFERAAVQTGGGLLLVPSGNGLVLFNESNQASILPGGSGIDISQLQIGSVYSGPSSGRSSGRSCTTTVNSTGHTGRLHAIANTSIANMTLLAVATDLPAGNFGIPVFGMAEFNVTFGDGRLCVSPLDASFTRGPVGRVEPDGVMRNEYDFTTAGSGGAFTAGTTWYHQVVFRDSGPNGLNATDTVFISFQP